MAQLCVFSLGDYKQGQKGFLAAKNDGAVDSIDIDEDSYTMLYNVQRTAFAVAAKLGQEVELGAFEGDTFVSISELDNVMEEDGGDSWDSLDEGFSRAVAIRNKKSYKYAALAIEVFSKLNYELPSKTSELVNIGCCFENGYNIENSDEGWLFDKDNLNWVCKSSTELTAKVNPKTGLL